MELYLRMLEAWELARQHQKNVYDRGTKNPFRAGERVFLFKPAERTGARRKFARPFHGPYRLVEVGTNTARICPVDKPESEPILVSLDRLRRCPEEVRDEFWPPSRAPKKTRRHHVNETRRQLSDGHEEGETTEDALLDSAAGGRLDDRQPHLQATADEAYGGSLDPEDGHDGELDSSGATGVSLPSTQRESESGHEDVEGITHRCRGKATGETAARTQDLTRTAAGTSGMTTSQGEDAFQNNMNPWTTAKEQAAELSLQQEEPTKKRRKRVENSLPGKWTGRLRSNRSPRTATRQQGEM
jgi:hypothetical protein